MRTRQDVNSFGGAEVVAALALHIRLLDLNRKDVAARAGQILRAGTVKTDEQLRANGQTMTTNL